MFKLREKPYLVPRKITVYEPDSSGKSVSSTAEIVYRLSANITAENKILLCDVIADWDLMNDDGDRMSCTPDNIARALGNMFFALAVDKGYADLLREDWQAKN